MEWLFVMDPMERVLPAQDTTYALMRAAMQRGHRVFHAHPSTVHLRGGSAFAKVRPVAVPGQGGVAFSWLGESQARAIDGFPIVWMRGDPPFDLRYVEVTWLLEHVDKARCRVLNDPAAVRGGNEKLYALRFPDLSPPTVVTNDRGLLWDFVRAHGEAVLKPLGRAGGEGIVFASATMRGLRALIELSTLNDERCVAQAYLPAADQGDKRILLLDGEVLGAVLRVHGPNEERNNLHLGGRAERAALSEADLRIVRRIGPALKAEGLVLVGIDVIDGWLTEVNVTSPTGIQELSRFDGQDRALDVVRWCEDHAPRP